MSAGGDRRTPAGAPPKDAPPTEGELALRDRLHAVLDLVGDPPGTARWRKLALIGAGLAAASVLPLGATSRSWFELAPLGALTAGVLAVLAAVVATARRPPAWHLGAVGAALAIAPVVSGSRVLSDSGAGIAVVAGLVMVGAAVWSSRSGDRRSRGWGSSRDLEDLVRELGADPAATDEDRTGAAAPRVGGADRDPLDPAQVARIDAALAARLAPPATSTIDRYAPWLWGAAALIGVAAHTGWWRDPTAVGSWSGRLVLPGTQLTGLGLAALVLFTALAVVTHLLGWKRLTALSLLVGVAAVASEAILSVALVLPLVPPGPGLLLVVGIGIAASVLTFAATSRRGVVVALVLGLLFGGVRPAIDLTSSSASPWDRVLTTRQDPRIAGTATAPSIDGVAVRADGTVVVASRWALFTLERDRLRLMRLLPPDTVEPRAILSASPGAIVLQGERGRTAALGTDQGDLVRLSAPDRTVVLVDAGAEQAPLLVVRRDDGSYVESSPFVEALLRDPIYVNEDEVPLDLPDGRPLAYDGTGVVVATDDELVFVTDGVEQPLPPQLVGCGPVDQLRPEMVVAVDGEVWTIDDERRVRRLRGGQVEVSPVVVIERGERVVDLAVHPDGPLVRTSRGLSQLRDAGAFTPEACEGGVAP